jgi:hypothetical protein
VDEHGHDVLARVRDLDGRAVDDFEVSAIRGYAKPHTLTLDIGHTKASLRLFLTGWTEYAFSSDNVAAFQAGLEAQAPRLLARDGKGKWQTVVEDVGFPVGRPQTLVVDLSGKLPPDTREVRLVTNMRVFWDQILIDDAAGPAPATLERLAPAVADLRNRGFSAPTRRAGATALDFDYDRVSTTFPWKLMPGAYTRLGDVRPLLTTVDDQFVIAHPGDEIALSFDARTLAALPAGFTRTFLLYVHGYSKEMNLHSASPDIVAPLPYSGMKEYPYPLKMTPLRDEEYWKYLADYNTRIVARPLPLLETLVAGVTEEPEPRP